MSDSMRCRGMRDLLPPEMARFRLVEQTFRDVCLGWGYEEVRTPTVEHLHLFTSAGTLSPQMLDRVYSFLDWDGWSGERVVLRPDSTIPVARLYVEQGQPQALRKFFYVQSVLRFAQNDESREEWQCGVELVGDTQPVGDIELVLIADEVFNGLGLKSTLKLSDPGIMRAVLATAGYDSADQLALYDRVLDGELAVLDEVAEKIPGAGASLRALLTIEGEGVPYIDNVRAALGSAVPQLERPLSELAAVSRTLSDLGREHSIAPLLMRNFEYYTGPAFQFYVGDQQVGSGGRYDGLIGLVGGPDTPASGLALDMEALLQMVNVSSEDAGRSLVVRPADGRQAALAATFELVGALRAAGVAFRIEGTDQGAAAAEAVASGDGFTLRLNGSEAQAFRRSEEVVRAITEASL